MELLIVVLVLAMIDLAAMRWGWDSTEAYHSPEWEKRAGFP
jgi:hypothetical protein